MMNRDVLARLDALEHHLIAKQAEWLGRLEAVLGVKLDTANAAIQNDVARLRQELEQKDVAIAAFEAERDQRKGALLTPKVSAVLARLGNRLPTDLQRAMRFRAVEMLANKMSEDEVCKRLEDGDVAEQHVASIVSDL